jgi:Sec-independent protein translocase protein TatA
MSRKWLILAIVLLVAGVVFNKQKLGQWGKKASEKP